jgi:hypothetical protein
MTMTDAVRVGDHFVCGKFNADLRFMRIDPVSTNITVTGSVAVCPACRTPNKVSYSTGLISRWLSWIDEAEYVTRAQGRHA